MSQKLMSSCMTILLCVTVSYAFTIPQAYAYKHPNIPQRIVSLKPNITELLFAIGAGDQVVGATTWCDRPEEAKKLPKVADYIRPDVEKILALRPDLVIGSEENSIKGPIKILEDLGVKTLLLKFDSVNDLFVSTAKLAKATGHIEEGDRLLSTLKEKIARQNPFTLSMSKGKNTNDNPKTLIIVGKKPLVAAGPKTFLGEIVELAGGRNIIDGKILYPHVNMETIIAKNPQVIFDLSMGSENSVDATWDRYKTITAVQNGRVHTLNISNFRVGPRLAEQVAELSSLLNR